MEINKEYELNVLLRMFGTIKYRIIDDSASELARNPITTELFNRVIKDFAPFIEKRGGVLDYGYIEDNPEDLNVIKYHLSNIETWDAMDIEQRKSIILNLVCPCKIKEETLAGLAASDTFVPGHLSGNKYWGFTVRQRAYISVFLDDFERAIAEKDGDRIVEMFKNVEVDEESIKTILNNLGLT